MFLASKYFSPHMRRKEDTCSFMSVKMKELLSISLYVPGIRVCQWQTISKFAVDQTKPTDTSSEDRNFRPIRGQYLPVTNALCGGKLECPNDNSRDKQEQAIRCY